MRGWQLVSLPDAVVIHRPKYLASPSLRYARRGSHGLRVGDSRPQRLPGGPGLGESQCGLRLVRDLFSGGRDASSELGGGAREAGLPWCWLQVGGSGVRGRCLSSGVFAVWRPGAGWELDFSACCLFAAAVAAEVWADVASAVGVEGESGWAAGGRVVAVAPFHEHDQGGRELASFVGEHVLRPAGPFGVRDAFEELLVAEALEPVGEDVGGDPELCLELLELR